MSCEEHLRAVECDNGNGNLTRAAVIWGMEMLAELDESKVSERIENGSSSSSRKRPRISTQNALCLDEILELIDQGEFGEHFVVQVETMMNIPECASLVSLIDHCLLMSLDQTTLEEGLHPENDQFWLVKFVVRQVLYNEHIRSLHFSRLDWLLAYLTAARPELFIQVLFDELAKSLLEDNSQEDVSLVPYLRQAGILEFSTLRVPELILAVSLPLVPFLRVAESNLACYSYAWLIQCCFSPRFFSCIAKACTPRFNMGSLWKQVESAKFKHVPLPTPWRSALVAGLSDAKAWLYTIVTKHIKAVPQLATDIVILASSFGDISLVQWLNQEFSAAVVLQITGNRKDNQCRALISSLQHNIYRICDTCLASRSSAQGHLLRTFQIILLGCEDQEVADVFVHATILDDRNSVAMLQIIATCMRTFGILERHKSVFKLWVQGLANILHVAQAEQIVSRLLAIRQLVDPLFWDKCLGDEVSRKRILRALCTALDVHWVGFLALLHKTGEYDILLNTLGLLQSITSEITTTIRDVEPKLKSAVGIFFHWVNNAQESTDKCHKMRANTLLKRLISHLAAASVASFAMLVTFLLDASFELQLIPSSATNTAVLSSGSSKVDRYGRVSFPSCVKREGISGGASAFVQSFSGQEKRAMLQEFSSLLMQSVKMAMRAMQSRPDDWPSHPAEVLGKLLSYRLETPHELSVTMEQYEEVLPKHVSFVRHTFLIDCIVQNTFLFKVLQLVMEHGQVGQLQICAELVRALVAESITKWQGQHIQVQDSEAGRMQLFDIIQLGVSAGWLPHPVASCGEIISLINAEDIPSLLLIVWRCMHDAMALGLHKAEATPENQATSVNDGSFKEWEVQFLSILRRNVSRIGAHIARLYPQRSNIW